MTKAKSTLPVKGSTVKSTAAQWAIDNPERHRENCARFYASNRDKMQAINRAWHAKNPERSRAASAAWYAANKERKAASRKRWMERNRDKRRAQQKEYRNKNKDKRKASWAAYYEKNKDGALARFYKRRALKAKAPVANERLIEAWRSTWKKGLIVRCYWCCGAFRPEGCHADHIIPLNGGGDHEIGNLCISCAPCNLSKNDKTIEEWNKELISPVLF